MSNPRIFIGIPISGSIIEHIKQKVISSRPMLPDEAHWVPEANYHITLHFLGAITLEQLEMIKTRVSEVVSRHPAFSTTGNFLHGLPIKKPKAWVIYCRLNQALASLYASIRNVLIQEDLRVENRPFLPHITLARLKADTLPKVPITALDIQVKEVILYESVSTESGSQYKPLKRFNLLEN